MKNVASVFTFLLATVCFVVLGLGLQDEEALAQKIMASPKAVEVTFAAGDGATGYGWHTRSKQNNDVVVLLFHQAGSNHYEYEPLLPFFRSAGYDTFALDQRSGGRKWNHVNKAAASTKGRKPYIAAMSDLVGAVTWAKRNNYKKIIIVGSSYSAALVFMLAEKFPKTITAVAAFSPGEHLGGKTRVAPAAAAVAKAGIPIFITSSADKREVAKAEALAKSARDAQAAATTTAAIDVVVPEVGVHGASTLRTDQNPEGYFEARKNFMVFLHSVDGRQ